MKIKILHNPRCSKSRQAAEFLEEKGVDFEIREYLKVPLNEKEIRDLVEKGIGLEEFYRGEKEIKNVEELVSELLEDPSKMQRPVIFNDTLAVIGRPTEKILDILEAK